MDIYKMFPLKIKKTVENLFFDGYGRNDGFTDKN